MLLHYWRFHLPAKTSTVPLKVIFDSNLRIVCPGETEVEFSTRLVKNAEDLIIKEGPETVNIRLITYGNCHLYVLGRCWHLNKTQISSFYIGAFMAEPDMVAVRVIPPPAT